MKAIFSATLFLLLCPTLLLAASPEEKAAVVAPFLDDQAVAVVHLDIAKIDVRPLLDQIRAWAPQGLALPDQDLETIEQNFATIRKTGATDAFVVVSLADVPERGPLLLFVLQPSSKEKEILAVLAPLGLVGHRQKNILLAGDPATIDRAKLVRPDSRPELAAAFGVTRPRTVQLLFIPTAKHREIFEQMMPTFPADVKGRPSSVLTQGMHWSAIALDLPPKLSMQAVVQSKDAPAAQEFSEFWSDLLNTLHTHVIQETLPNWQYVQKSLVLTPQQDRLVLDLKQGDDAMQGVVTAVETAFRDAWYDAARERSMHNLKQIALAMHNHHDNKKSLPMPANDAPDGTPLLSWRVHLLPLLGISEASKLYKQFHLNEPWDSEHNKQLIDKMPEVYRSPLQRRDEQGKTVYLAPVGKGAIFTRGKATTLKEITDGLSNTIMMVEVEPSKAVIWTKPDDLQFNPEGPLEGIGKPYRLGFNTAFGDGSARFLRYDLKPETLRAMFTATGGEVIEY